MRSASASIEASTAAWVGSLSPIAGIALSAATPLSVCGQTATVGQGQKHRGEGPHYQLRQPIGGRSSAFCRAVGRWAFVDVASSPVSSIVSAKTGPRSASLPFGGFGGENFCAAALVPPGRATTSLSLHEKHSRR